MTTPKNITTLDMLCPICGVNKVEHDRIKFIKREHIPPRGIFIDKTDEHGLISVPSCLSCNGGTKHLDEEFKVQLSILLGIDTESKKRLWHSCRKTLNKQNKLKQNLLTKTTPLLMPYNKGYGHPIMLETKVINTVVKKIIRGLHWHVTGEAIPVGIRSTIHVIKQGSTLNLDLSIIFQKFGKSIQKCGKQFEAIYAIAEDSKFSSIWLLRFYETDSFIGVIKPTQRTVTHSIPSSTSSPPPSQSSAQYRP